MNQTLLVNRKDFRDTKLVSTPNTDLADHHIRVDIGPFALTANNITYMVTGDMIGYWKFFAPKAYAIDAEGFGRMPVWGYGIVTGSKCADIAVGTRVYGFFPIANSIDLKPAKLSSLGFQDGAEHRAHLHPVYNSYTLVENDPSFDPKLDDLQPVLRPLFTTSFLIDDFFADNGFFGAEQIVLLSASSKTALGSAFCLKNREAAKIIGLTSKTNMAFTTNTGFYDQVENYTDIDNLDATKKTALIDMAGNGEVNAKLYDLFGDNLVYNCMVGKSHWQGAPPPKSEKGAPPAMFFAPDQAKKRIKEWGGAEFAKNLAASWLPFCDSAGHWLDITKQSGDATLLECYNGFLDGKANPSQGNLFTL
ncbi:MAG: hypothetical protein COA91_08315 [Robiginitomaculum sp.]|nr:MAG: hypothetical protein COA91_08315 [Robiginitomaculum sp.]